MFINLHERIEIVVQAIIAKHYAAESYDFSPTVEPIKRTHFYTEETLKIALITFGFKTTKQGFTKGEYKYGITIMSDAGKKYATVLFSNSNTFITQYHIPHQSEYHWSKK